MKQPKSDPEQGQAALLASDHRARSGVACVDVPKHNAQRLLVMIDEDFRELVADDCRGERVDALRHDDVLDRWKVNLTYLWHLVDAQLKGAAGEYDPDTRSWRRAALTFRAGVSARAGEADILIKRRNVRQQEEQTAAARARNGGRSTAELRGEAGEEAIQRLIAAHLDEFTGYFREAKAARRSEAGGQRG